MKKMLFALAAIGSLVLAGCSEKKAEEVVEFVDTSDLKMYELTGNVKSVKAYTVKRGNEELIYTLAFDANGLATTHKYDLDLDIDANVNVERNEKGEITIYNAALPDAKKAKVNVEYTYNEKGQAEKIVTVRDGWNKTTEKVKYDEQNNRLKATAESYEDDMRIVDDITYNYKSYDEKGNWTERELTIRNRTIDWEGDVLHEQTIRKTEKREILYY
ncbi:MAG: hypothetical protein IKJ23_07740 [Bacteroidaceae bacterium]|nr:hypothetical protein [Bacteroidaceae bacterium]